MAKDIQFENRSRQIYRGFDNRMCFQINATTKARMEFVELTNVAGTPAGILNLLDSPNTNGGARRFSLPNSASPNDGIAISRLWSSYSSLRYKENIVDIGNTTNVIRNLRPVNFKWKNQYGGYQDAGFIAEEIGDLIPAASIPDSDGTYVGVDYSKVLPFLCSFIKQQIKTIDQLDKKVQDIENGKRRTNI